MLGFQRAYRKPVACGELVERRPPGRRSAPSGNGVRVRPNNTAVGHPGRCRHNIAGEHGRAQFKAASTSLHKTLRHVLAARAHFATAEIFGALFGRTCSRARSLQPLRLPPERTIADTARQQGEVSVNPSRCAPSALEISGIENIALRHREIACRIERERDRPGQARMIRDVR